MACTRTPRPVSVAANCCAAFDFAPELSAVATRVGAGGVGAFFGAVSFFGGGTDYPTWFREHGGAVLSTTIDKYLYPNDPQKAPVTGVTRQRAAEMALLGRTYGAREMER